MEHLDRMVYIFRSSFPLYCVRNRNGHEPYQGWQQSVRHRPMVYTCLHDRNKSMNREQPDCKDHNSISYLNRECPLRNRYGHHPKYEVSKIQF